MVTRRDVASGAAPVSGTGARRHGFRPLTRRRSRLATGVVLGALAIGGNLVVYSSLDDRQTVLQAVRDVPAGAVLTNDDVAPVAVGASASVRTVPVEDLASTVGRYARVRISAGSLVVEEALQDRPLVSPDAAVVAVQVPEGAVPLGVRERSRLELVVPLGDDRHVVVAARTVGVPGEAASLTGMVSISVEVSVDDAALVATSERVGVLLVHPDRDGEDGSS